MKKRLDYFGLKFDEHFFACVSDGASVMVKFGKLATSESELCFAHGIHLAVCDAVYEKKKKSKTVSDNDSEPDEFDSDSEIEEGENDDDKNKSIAVYDDELCESEVGSDDVFD